MAAASTCTGSTHTLLRQYLGITDFRGAQISKVRDMHPIYLLTDPKVALRGNPFQKGQGLDGEALKKAFAEYRAKNITPQEEAVVKAGVSDGDFHYLGSGKIMVGIGRGFADALGEFMRKK